MDLLPHIMVIDPGVRSPEIDTFNGIARNSPLACTYHLPAMFGFDSFPDSYQSVRAIIILGSLASVHDRWPWQVKLEDWVKNAIDQGVPVLGFCYGHQMLAYMFGGDVSFVRHDRTKLEGIRQVEILENPVWQAGQRNLVVTHAEAVTRLPSHMSVIAKSNEIAIDGLAVKNKPVYGFQAHPEATEVFLKTRQMLTAQSLQVLGDGAEMIRQFVHMALGKST